MLVSDVVRPVTEITSSEVVAAVTAAKLFLLFPPLFCGSSVDTTALGSGVAVGENCRALGVGSKGQRTVSKDCLPVLVALSFWADELFFDDFSCCA